MLQTLGNISQLTALFLTLPAFVTAVLILKEYTIRNIRFAKHFKLLMLQGLIHSLLLVLCLFFQDFKSAFIIHSFGMIPLYGLLLFRNYHLKYIRQCRNEAIKLYKMPKPRVKQPKIDPSKIKAIPKVKSGYNWR
jgi:hypothetical protein